MEQFSLVTVSVYNRKLINQPVTKQQELPKNQPSQIPTYQMDSYKKEVNTIFFSKADTLVDKILSPYQAVKFTNFNFGWCTNWNFFVGLCSTPSLLKRRRSRPLLYFTCRSCYLSDSDSESECQN